MNIFERIYNQTFGNLGNKKQDAIQNGWKVNIDKIGSLSNFRRYANKEGWKVYNMGSYLLIK